MQPAETVIRARSDYSELLRRVKEARLLHRRPVYYVVRIAVIVLLFVGGRVTFALLGRSWWQLAVAGALALVLAQVGFLGHDAGHRQVFRSRRANDAVGFLSDNLGIGLSFCAECGVPYLQSTLLGSYGLALGHLRTVGRG